jgi:hypothetical protein
MRLLIRQRSLHQWLLYTNYHLKFNNKDNKKYTSNFLTMVFVVHIFNIQVSVQMLQHIFPVVDNTWNRQGHNRSAIHSYKPILHTS